MPETVSRTFAGTGTTIQTAVEQSDSLLTSYLRAPLPLKEIVTVTAALAFDGSMFVHTLTVITREHKTNFDDYLVKRTSPYEPISEKIRKNG